MFLRNYDNLMVALNTPSVTKNGKVASTDTKIFGDGYLNFKDTSGSIHTIGMSSKNVLSPLLYYIENNPNDYYSGSGNIIIGNGSSSVTYDDYQLHTLISTSDISTVTNGTTIERNYDDATGEWTSIVKKVYCALKDTTVTEIGISTGCYYDGTYTSAVLIFRELLETPVEVPANSNVVISFAFKMNGNPNNPAVSVSVE